MRADTRKYAQIHANTRKYEQVHAHTCKYAQIHANTSKYTQIHGYTQMLHNRVTSAARERAQRAQRAKRRKDTTSSHEQVQRATCSSVRRHVPATLFMKTRFPFTYQTGFKGGQKLNDFSPSIFAKINGKIVENRVSKSIPPKTPQISIFRAFWLPKTRPKPHQNREKNQ